MIIADDSPGLREMLRQALEHMGVEVVADVANPTELMVQVRAYRPDAVLVDINFGGATGDVDDAGIRAAVTLRDDYPELGILLLSVYMTQAYLRRIAKIGDGTHIGYLGKDRTRTREIYDALHRVAEGGIVLDPTLTAEMLRPSRVQNPLSKLTRRQREVLELLAEGYTNKAIADRLHVAIATIETYVSDVFNTLQIPRSSDDHRRVLAVLTWLRNVGTEPPD